MRSFAHENSPLRVESLMREETNARKQKSANQISVIKNVERKQTFSGTGVLILAEYKNGRNMQNLQILSLTAAKIGQISQFKGFLRKKQRLLHLIHFN